MNEIKPIDYLKYNYRVACNDYLRAFCLKHDYEFDEDAWVGDMPGTVACIGDYIVEMDTIIADIDYNIPEEAFIRWYDYCERLPKNSDIYPNFKSWALGLREFYEDGTHKCCY
jgi:hypothetical protein